MRVIICICFAAAWQLQAQGPIFTPAGSYAGEVSRRANAKVVFRASVGDFTTGPLKMELVAQDADTLDDIIILRAPAQQRNRIIKAHFPFGGRYLGRYNADRNVIVGNLAGFARRGRPNIPRQRFEMTPLNPNAVASPPVN